MNKTLLTLACAMIAPVAFAQTSTTTTEQTTTAPAAVERTTTTTAPVVEKTTTTTAPVAATTTETTTTYTDGTVTTYVPGKTIVVRKQGVTDPISYTIGKTVRFVNKAGKEIKEHTIKPGARVHVYYDGTGSTQVVSRVVVDDD
jgi:hypothetical protein